MFLILIKLIIIINIFDKKINELCFVIHDETGVFSKMGNVIKLIVKIFPYVTFVCVGAIKECFYASPPGITYENVQLFYFIYLF